MTGSLVTMNKNEEYIPSRFTRDKKIFEMYWAWHKATYHTEPSSQQILVCCDWALHLLKHPPQADD